MSDIFLMINVFATSVTPIVPIKTLQSLIQTLDILPCFRNNRTFLALSLFSCQTFINVSICALKFFGVSKHLYFILYMPDVH